jgi:hypothetical protein
MRILFVALPDSIHAARWINQVTNQGWDVHLFPANKYPVHPQFRNITTYGFGAFRPKELDGSVRWRQLWPRRGTSRLSLLASRFNPGLMDRPTWLARVIRKIKPDIIHSLEFQQAGYLTLAAKSRLAEEDFPPWAVSNWGSDVYLFGRLAEHAEKVRGILSACDFYHCECQRDVELARSMGLRGRVLPLSPASGGFDVESMRQLRPPGLTSAKRVIVLKGYQNWAGRALVGLRAIEMCADVLKGYKVRVYLGTPDVKLAAELLTARTGIPVEMEEKDIHANTHILRLHGSARISIGLSISDAISQSLLEAMIMGSFPIQSNTSCADEWLRHGESGFIVPAEDSAPIAEAIRRAVIDDVLVDKASEINLKVARERLDTSVVQPQVVEMYNGMFAQSGRKPTKPGNDSETIESRFPEMDQE